VELWPATPWGNTGGKPHNIAPTPRPALRADEALVEGYRGGDCGGGVREWRVECASRCLGAV